MLSIILAEIKLSHAAKHPNFGGTMYGSIEMVIRLDTSWKQNRLNSFPKMNKIQTLSAILTFDFQEPENMDMHISESRFCRFVRVSISNTSTMDNCTSAQGGFEYDFIENTI